MFHDFQEAVVFARAHAIAMVDLKFRDLAGRWRHVTLPVARFTPGPLHSHQRQRSGRMTPFPGGNFRFSDTGVWCPKPAERCSCFVWRAVS